MNRLAQLFISQARALPLLALLQIGLGLVSRDYHSLSQHISELGLRDEGIGLSIRVLAALLGVSLLMLTIGLFMAAHIKRKLSLLMLLLFAIAMLSNGLVKMGSPWHGLYGAGMIIVLIPIALALEFSEQITNKRLALTATATSFFSFAYLWLGVVGFEPETYAGLLQRVIMLINLFWFAYFASNFKLTK